MNDVETNIVKMVDKTFEKADTLMLIPIGIKFDRETYNRFVVDLVKQCKYINTKATRYKNARIIAGYKATVQAKEVENGLMCASIWNDFGFHSIRTAFIPFSLEDKDIIW